MTQSADTEQFMQSVAKGLDKICNPEGERKLGFVLLVFPFGGPEGARCNYVSNAERKDIITALKEIVARFEGRVQETGTVQ